MICLISHGWNQCHRRCPRANDHNSLPLIVEVLGPLLRMHHLPRKCVQPWNLRRVSLGVVVIPRTHKQVVTCVGHCASTHLCIYCPTRLNRGPLSTGHHVAKSHFAANVVFIGCLIEILQNRWAICDGFLRRPWLEAVSQSVHVAIGANSWIAKQIPRATNGVATFENDIGLRRAVTLKEIPCSNSGNSSAYNNHIKMFHLGRLEQHTWLATLLHSKR